MPTTPTPPTTPKPKRAVQDSGEMTYMNLVHLAGCDGTNPDSLTRLEIKGRKQAMLDVEVLRRYTTGCNGVRLPDFGMTRPGNDSVIRALSGVRQSHKPVST